MAILLVLLLATVSMTSLSGCTPLEPGGGASERVTAGARAQGAYHTVSRGETLWRISRTYGVSIAEITEANGLRNHDLAVGQRLLIPGAERQLEVRPPASRAHDEPVTPGNIKTALAWPLAGRGRTSVSSGFGPRDGSGGGSTFHQGIDLTGAREERILAAASGEVVYAGRMSGYGNVVMIDHGARLITVYAHLSRVIVSLEDLVSKGQVIGYMGSTGTSTGTHLHFEVRYKGVPVDPLDYLP
jgi:murein DD-endopeptidase MepM/ murein hydrolase activator NlpD